MNSKFKYDPVRDSTVNWKFKYDPVRDPADNSQFKYGHSLALNSTKYAVSTCT